MWTLYGTTSGNVSNITNPMTLTIGDFKASSAISEADFNNISNTFLAYDMGINNPPLIVTPSNNTYNNYVDIKGHSTNFLSNARVNILHRNTAEDGHFVYEYDGCYYQWIFHTSGTNLYYFEAYRQNTITYDHCPAVAFNMYTNAEIKKDNVRSMHLIATKGNSASGIGVVRPLWCLDLSNQGMGKPFAEHPIQYVLGPALPAATVDEWLKNSVDENPDAPVKPNPDQEHANEHSAFTQDFTWLNNFKIMNWSGNWPKKMLIDGGFNRDNIQDYFIFNNDNDPGFDYHTDIISTQSSTGQASFDNVIRVCQTKIQAMSEWGHSVVAWMQPTGSTAEGYFTTMNSTIDDYPVTCTQRTLKGTADLIDVDDLTIDHTPSGATFTVNQIVFTTGSKSFSISNNYPHNSITFYGYGSNWPNPSFYDCCVIRHNGEYYLGGMFRFYGMSYGAGNYGSVGGFAILCQITNLDRLSNNGGSNPEDPTGSGLSSGDLNDTFGPGNLGPNPTTESEINNSLGNYPYDDGSAYNPDGTPRDPADVGMGDSTGEKQTIPIDSHQVINIHDGSMGNGTGDVHQNDTKIADPATTLPSGIDVPGTVSGSGVLSVFTPSYSELQSFTSELLSNSVMAAIHNYFTTNPMDGIFGLHMLPYTGFAGTATASPRIGTHDFTSVLTLAANEFITIDYGTINIPFVYNGFENYAPMSDAKIFLPFIGTKDIDINLIQGCDVSLKYNVSLTTGDIYAFLYSQWASAWGDAETEKGVEHLLYHWQGNCAATVPLSHLDNTNYISGAMQIAGGITSIASGGISGNPMAILGGIGGVAGGVGEFGRTSLVTSGNISGMAAFMGCREPYLILSRPIIAFSEAYNHYQGQRANAIQSIGQLRMGTFTKMQNVDLEGVGATEDELTEIAGILKGGFYI